MNLAGQSFVFGRKDGSIIGSLQLREDRKIFTHQPNPNEHTWEIDGDRLYFFDTRGSLKTLFTIKEGRFFGDFFDKKIIHNHHFLEPFSPSWVGREFSGRKLIYTVALGERHVEMAQMMIASLIGPGQYGGDVMVFTDRPGEFDANIIRVVRYSANGITVSPKILCGQMIRGDEYDRIMFLDTDILAFRPVDGLFASGGFNLSRHASGSIRHMGQSDALNTREKERSFGDVMVNGGTFGAVGGEFNEIMDWCHEILSKGTYRICQGKWASEETALSKIFYDGQYFSEWYSMYDINFGHCGHPVKNPILYHYTASKDRMRADFEKMEK